jgi:hypothetical protein
VQNKLSYSNNLHLSDSPGSAQNISVQISNGGPSYGSTFYILITLSSEVVKLENADFTIVGGSSIASVSSTKQNSTLVYESSISFTKPGSITIFINADVLSDASANTNLKSNEFIITYTPTVPNIVISSIEENYTNKSVFQLQFTASEEIQGFDISDLTVTNGVASNLQSTDNINYTVNLAPASEGQVTLAIPVGSYASKDDNISNQISSNFSIVYDTRPPIVSLFYPPGGTEVLVNLFKVRINADEPTKDFDNTHFNFSNCFPNNFDIIDSQNTDITIVAINKGAISIEYINNNTDLAGNSTLSGYTLNLNYNPPPVFTYTLSSSVAVAPTEITNIEIPIRMEFNDPIKGIDPDVFELENCSIDKIQTVTSGTVYDVFLNPLNDGLLSLTLKKNSIFRVSDNFYNIDSKTISFNHKNTGPKVSISSNTKNNSTSNDQYHFVNINLIESTINPLQSSDISIWSDDGGIASVDDIFLDSPNQYEVRIEITKNGEFNIIIPHAQIDYTAGTVNTKSNTYVFQSDRTPPQVELSVVDDKVNYTKIPLRVDFYEAVYSLDISDFNVTPNSHYVTDIVFTEGDDFAIFDLNVVDVGETRIELKPNSVYDNVNIFNTSSNILKVFYETEGTNVTLSTVDNVINAYETMIAKLELEYEVLNLSGGMFNVTNGSVLKITKIGFNQYDVIITPDKAGLVEVSVLAGIVKDVYDNDNKVSNTLVFTYDNVLPIPTISADKTTSTQTDDIQFTIAFNKEVVNFDYSMISSTIPVNFSTMSSTDNINFTINTNFPTEGEYTISIAPDQINDNVDNRNVKSNDFTIIYDKTAPEVSFVHSYPFFVFDKNLNVEIGLSEPTNVLTASSFSTQNSNITNLTAIPSTNNYNIEFEAVNEGPFKLLIPANTIYDNYGNYLSVDKSIEFYYDSAVPSVILLPTLSGKINNSSFEMKIVFSEHVLNFDISDINLNIPITGMNLVQLSSDEYKLTANLVAGNDYEFQILAKAVTDIAGRESTASNIVEVSFDDTPLLLNLVTSKTDYSNQNIDIKIVSNKELASFSSSKISLSNGSFSTFVNVDDKEFSSIISSMTEGSVDLTIPVNSFADEYGNYNNTEYTISWVYDVTKPTVNISADYTGKTNQSNINLVFDFSEDIKDFELADISLSSPVALDPLVKVNDKKYTSSINFTGNTTVDISILADKFSDLSSNLNLVSNLVSIDYSNDKPEVSLTDNYTPYVKSPQLTIPVSISKEATDLSVSDFEIVNLKILALNKINSTEYSLEIEALNQGEFKLHVKENVITDAWGNTNLKTAELKWNFDNVEPTVSISSSLIGKTNQTSGQLTIVFSEEVTGFVPADIYSSNTINISNFATVDNITYTLDYEFTLLGVYEIKIPSSVSQDLAGNNNQESSQIDIDFNNSQTPLVISLVTNPIVIDGYIEFAVTNVMGINDLSISDIEFTNADLISYTEIPSSGGTVYVGLRAKNNGNCEIKIPANSTFDDYGNPHLISNTETVYYDALDPELVISSDFAPKTNQNTGKLTFLFSEDVVDFGINDIKSSNAINKSNFFKIADNHYTVDVELIGNGLFELYVPEKVLTDKNFRLNKVSNTLIVDYNTSAPVISLSTSSLAYTNQSNIVVEILSDKKITDLSLANISLTNIVSSNFIKISDTEYRFEGVLQAEGNSSIFVNSNSVSDEYGNDNAKSNEITLYYDVAIPTVSINSTLTGKTNNNSGMLDITFSEEIKNFDVSDFNITGDLSFGTLSSVNNINFSLPFTINSSGLVAISIGENSVEDLSGRLNTVSNIISVDFNNDAPIVTISKPEQEYQNSAILIEFDFDKELVGFEQTDISLQNANIIDFNKISELKYQITVRAISEGAFKLYIDKDKFTDSYSNYNTKTDELNYIYDVTNPTVVQQSSVQGPSYKSEVEINYEFSEYVKSFSTAALSVVNADIVVLNTTDSVNFDLTIRPDRQGLYSVDLIASKVKDRAENNTANTVTFNNIFDNISPVISLSTSVKLTNTNPIVYQVDMSEALALFETSNIQFNNCVESKLTMVSPTQYILEVDATGQGECSVYIKDNLFVDIAGNNNVGDLKAVKFDSEKPTVNIVSSEPSPVSSYEFEAFIGFNEQVFGLDEGMLKISNAKIVSLTSSDDVIYTLKLNPVGDGNIKLSIDKDMVTDEANNLNLASNNFEIEFSNLPPDFIIVTEDDTHTNKEFLELEIKFNEWIQNLEESSLGLDNLVVNSISTDDNILYKLNISPESEGESVIELESNKVYDIFSLGNNKTKSLVLSFDYTQPRIELKTEYLITNKSSLTIDIISDEKLKSFDIDELSLKNVDSKFLNVITDNIHYQLVFNANVEGELILNVPDSVFTDLAGNPNLGSEISIVYDITKPNLIVDSKTYPMINVQNTEIEFNFSEEINDFSTEDILVKNGLLENVVFDEESGKYKADLYPVDYGEVIISVSENGIFDKAGNYNDETSLSMFYTKSMIYANDDFYLYLSNSDNSLNIVFSKDFELERTVSIIDIFGRPMLSKFTSSRTDNIYDISGLVPGIYAVVVKANDYFRLKKFVVN